MSRRSRVGLWACTVFAALIGLVCLDHTRRSLSGTFDESNHLATGLEWWQFGSYSQWTENPPLPRLAVAALPYFHGMRLPPREQWEARTHNWDRTWEVGSDLLYAGDGFERNLGRARLGTLPFYLLALVAAFGLADGRRRPLAGLVAVALTATLPALIAHGALATTDVGFVGTFLLATLGLLRWFERPTRRRAVALGAALGLTLLTKFSTLVFFPVTVLAFFAAHRLGGRSARPAPAGQPLGWRVVAGHAGLAALAAFLVTWAGYRFSVGRIDDFTPAVQDWFRILPPPAERSALTRFLLHLPLPMPELFHGLLFLAGHDAVGHDAYLLGRNSEHGFLAFYPVALLVKTPLPFLTLLALSVPFVARRRAESWVAAATALAAGGILLVSLRSHVNLGIRHVFVLLPLGAVTIARAVDGALGAWDGAKRRAAVAALAVLLVAELGIAIGARSKELGYFNALAGADPAAILLDSDLDWGQDLFNLRREARARGIDRIKIAFFGMLRLCQHDLPPLEALVPGRPTTGWIAISENYYRHRSNFRLLKDPCDPKSTYRDGDEPKETFAWLGAYAPVSIVGSSIRLYRIE